MPNVQLFLLNTEKALYKTGIHCTLLSIPIHFKGNNYYKHYARGAYSI